ncbi:NUDIX hydrolase [Paenibacillus rhizovicinus]|uniref:NUDIX hydrolase n=1 Tax=Paenibacillus rhizovicinus TaxID=2704463 RepID=A0A6C0NX89_9BACL|nr:NUDIX hydrolase [Paenibacillus rhizovicinus]QHW30546.1 NUDIX hydrolase [Paenibacillus rhizovicinus]
MSNSWHRHLGIYGICRSEDRLLLIHKTGGPYTGRFDLPGGSVEPNETIIETLHREFLEETGVVVTPLRSIGTKDFLVPWVREGYAHTHCHHIAGLFEVAYESGDPSESPRIDDSLGAEWVPISQIDADQASPLVMAALDWIRHGVLDWRTKRYDSWEMKA